ncbi:hypothetical protein K7X08_023541 [Anisodus acutangulus]|uniref:Uncharacterized protein n=1 Tax=Anisodus acutangulus TaxID=402998 RepID=A0A9Q1L8P7_9SOLA|nr:hypothetical protein K7X08_023541 [Anisodus acutangulus]
MNGKGLVYLSDDMYGHLGELAFVCAGTWVLQVGLLYTDVFALEGCENLLVGLAKGKNDVKCDLEENCIDGSVVYSARCRRDDYEFALLNRNKRMRCGDS